MEVPLKCHWSAVGVKTANSHSHRPSLANSPTIHSRLAQNLIFLFKLCHHRPIQGICSLTRSFHDTGKWVFCNGADRQTDKQTTMATLWLNRPRGLIQLKFSFPWKLDFCSDTFWNFFSCAYLKDQQIMPYGIKIQFFQITICAEFT